MPGPTNTARIRQENNKFFDSVANLTPAEYARALMTHSTTADSSVGMPKVTEPNGPNYWMESKELKANPIFQSQAKISYMDPRESLRHVGNQTRRYEHGTPEGLETRRKDWGYMPHRKTEWGDWADKRVHQQHVMKKR
jgi:hypothetical protein